MRKIRFSMLRNLLSKYSASLYITGLSASGKTSVAKIISRKIGLPVLDSGIGFRLVAFIMLKNKLNASHTHEIAAKLSKFSISSKNGCMQVLALNSTEENNILRELHNDDINNVVASVAQNKAIRSMVLKSLKKNSNGKFIVVSRNSNELFTDGNIVEVCLEADLESRAERRALDLGIYDIATVKNELRNRDTIDTLGSGYVSGLNSVSNNNQSINITADRVVEKAIEFLENCLEIKNYLKIKKNSVDLSVNKLLLVVKKEIEDLMQEDISTKLSKKILLNQILLYLIQYRPNNIFSNFDELFFEDLNQASNLTNVDESKLEKLKINRNWLRNEVASQVCIMNKLLSRYEILLSPNGIYASDTIVKNTENGIVICVDNGQVRNEKNTGSNVVLSSIHLRMVPEEVSRIIEEKFHYIHDFRGGADIISIGLYDDKNKRCEGGLSFPIAYVSFSFSVRKYLLPVLAKFNLYPEQVMVLTRAFGFDGCPRNTMSLLFKKATDILRKENPKIRAIISDVNPNWGFSGISFKNGGFKLFAVKKSYCHYVDGVYKTRRQIDLSNQQAVKNKFPIVYTNILMKPLNKGLAKKIREEEFIYIISDQIYASNL